MHRGGRDVAVPSRAALLAGIAFCIIMLFGQHTVPEGHVGVYYRMGALLSTYTMPGLHFKVPFITHVHMIQVTLQTDEVRNIPCGTSGGVVIMFDKIEVVNRLRAEYVIDTIREFSPHYDQLHIFQKIHHEINQFCSSHTLQQVYIDEFSTVDDKLKEALQDGAKAMVPGLDIVAVRITKPTIPESIQHNYEDMERQKTKFLAAEQEQHVVRKEAETQKMKAEVQAKQAAEIGKIKAEQTIMEKEAASKIATIENQILMDHERALADANAYRLKMQAEAEAYKRLKEADANQVLLTKEFLQYSRDQAIAANTKIYFGDSIPTMFYDQASGVSSSSAASTTTPAAGSKRASMTPTPIAPAAATA